MANRHRTDDTPKLAAQGQSVSRKTVAEVPLTGLFFARSGAGAVLDGIIVNRGTIHHGFTVANQSIVVSAGSGTGAFNAGTLDVLDGDLAFLDGTIRLEAAIAVTAVPETSTLALGAAGIACAAWLRRHRRRAMRKSGKSGTGAGLVS